MGQNDRAMKDYDQAIKLDPAYAKAFYNRGISKRKRGHKAAGDADIAKAKEIDPKVHQ
jgi:tetratricopeptide (TPR) repeat protein